MSNEPREPTPDIDLKVRSYIDDACQATITMLIRKMKEIMNRQAESQRKWNEQIQKSIEEHFSRLAQVGITTTEANLDNRANPKEERNEHTTPATICSQSESRNDLPQGNYPPTPILNSMIIDSAPLETSTSTRDELSITRNKARKYLSINYTTLKQLPVVKDFMNQLAASIESKRLWWVSNWSEGQKVIEMLPCKLNLTSRLWKAIAFGAYVDIQEFGHKNMRANAKFYHEEILLQASEGGYITIRKRPAYNKFNDIADWLMAFSSYMEAILIIYEERESELNFYRNHISNLCIKYEFNAIMAYDEDCRLTLAMDRDTTLLERNIEAEGKNFDITTTKRARFSKPQLAKIDTAWYDGREICINWNRRGCNDERKYG